jgi:molybdate transport repressor ModE-like protein
VEHTSALRLVLTGDPTLFAIVRLSLMVSLSATFLGAFVGAPLGALIALTRFRGRDAVLILLNALMGLPPVLVGLAVYLMLSRSGPLGSWGLPFTPPAMVIAQTVLVTPIDVGPGKIELLEQIERAGSLSKAARDNGMSYRRAWQLLESLNSSFATPVAVARMGGYGGGGATTLTPPWERTDSPLSGFRVKDPGACGKTLRAFEGGHPHEEAVGRAGARGPSHRSQASICRVDSGVAASTARSTRASTLILAETASGLRFVDVLAVIGTKGVLKNALPGIVA